MKIEYEQIKKHRPCYNGYNVAVRTNKTDLHRGTCNNNQDNFLNESCIFSIL